MLRARTTGRYRASCAAVKSLLSCVMLDCRFKVRWETVPRSLFDMMIQEAYGPMSGCLESVVEVFDAQD